MLFIQYICTTYIYSLGVRVCLNLIIREWNNGERNAKNGMVILWWFDCEALWRHLISLRIKAGSNSSEMPVCALWTVKIRFLNKVLWTIYWMGKIYHDLLGKWSISVIYHGCFFGNVGPLYQLPMEGSQIAIRNKVPIVVHYFAGLLIAVFVCV